MTSQAPEKIQRLLGAKNKVFRRFLGLVATCPRCLKDLKTLTQNMVL